MELSIAIHLMCVGFTIGMTCPDSSQWKLRGSGYCNHTHPFYSCLYDENYMTYKEFCRERPDVQRPGYKFIIRGDLDGKPCDDTHYQPIKFWTNGSSHCLFKKSTCNEEGQLTFTNGNGISNKKCRCDYTAGYAFITKPEATCFCNPEQEDCACYLTTCKPFYLLTPDYECIRQIEWSGDFRCPLQKELSLNTEKTTKSTDCSFFKHEEVWKRDNVYEIDNMRQPTYTAILALLFTFVMLIIICKKCLRKSLEKCSNILHIDEYIAKGVREEIKNVLSDLNEQYLIEWSKSDQIFVETAATMQIKKQLRTDHFVLIVGGPGSGKSSILKHIAIEMCNRYDFDVISVVMEPSSIFQYHSCKRKQIFVIDDLCGMYETCPQSVDIWAIQMEAILKLLGIDILGTTESQKGNFKLLMTCSSSIYQGKNFKRFKIPKKYVCKLSDFKLSKDQMREMMSKVRFNKYDLKSQTI